MAGYMPKGAKPVASEPYRPKGARPAETVQPAPEPSARPGVLRRSMALGGLLPIAGLGSLVSPLYDFATDSKSSESYDDMLTGVENGYTLGFRDELGGAIGAAAGQDYTATRDRLRGDADAARVRSPKANFVGEITGGAALPGGGSTASGARMLTRTLAQGAAAGVGNSTATDATGMAVDSGIGAGSALALHGLGKHVAAPIARRLQPVLRRALNAIGVSQGRRALTNGADSLSSRKELRPEAVQEAIDSNDLLPFSTTAGTRIRLAQTAEIKGERYGALLEELEKQGVKGPVAGELAEELAGRAALLEPNTLNPALPREFERFAGRVMSKAEPGERMALTQAESLKRSAQEMADYARVGGDKPMNGVRKEIASAIRQANEDAVEAAGNAAPYGSDVQLLAEGFVPLKQRLGNTLEALGAAERGTARGAQRGFFSLADKINMAGAADPLTAAAKGIGGALWSARGPSTVAWTSRKLAESRALTDALRNSPAILSRSAAPVSNAEQDLIIEWLRARENPAQE